MKSTSIFKAKSVGRVQTTLFKDGSPASFDLSKNEGWLRNRLREWVSSEISLVKASTCLAVTPATIRKILSGQPISVYLRKKIERGLRNWPYPSLDQVESLHVQRLRLVYRLYREKGTLAKVGKKLGLSRERVRQLLDKSETLGLFEYYRLNPRLTPNVPKKKIIEDYREQLQLKKVAMVNVISSFQLRRLLSIHGISKGELRKIFVEGQERIWLSKYNAIVEKLGYHPSTRELQQRLNGNYLTTKIVQLWGSIHTFRKTFGITFSPRGKVSPQNSVSNKLMSQCAKKLKMNAGKDL